MINLPEFDNHRQQYAGLKLAPLQITAVYKPGASRVNYQRQTLDNLLANQVVRQAVGCPDLPNNPDCYDIPLPLKCLWRNADGWPLWGASYFWPESEIYQWSMVQHKRAISGHWSTGRSKNKTLAINKASGKHKEKRIPVPAETSVSGRYIAMAIGHLETVCELLENVTQLSGRRGIGMGEVNYFEVSEVDYVDVLVVGGKLARAIPLGAAELLPKHTRIVDHYVPSVGWTPPQWKPTLFSPGWFAGSPIEVDYFAAA
jgi:CRISPR type IV-associated protein Csf3